MHLVFLSSRKVAYDGVPLAGNVTATTHQLIGRSGQIKYYLDSSMKEVANRWHLVDSPTLVSSELGHEQGRGLGLREILFPLIVVGES